MTPWSECVVTPAGYDLMPVTPAFLASITVSGVMSGCRYSDMRNVTLGSRSWRRFWYFNACWTVVIGGTKFGCDHQLRTYSQWSLFLTITYTVLTPPSRMVGLLEVSKGGSPTALGDPYTIRSVIGPSRRCTCISAAAGSSKPSNFSNAILSPFLREIRERVW